MCHIEGGATWKLREVGVVWKQCQTDRQEEYRVTVVVALAGSLTSPTFTPDPSRRSWHSLTPSQVTREPRGLGDGNIDFVTI